MINSLTLFPKTIDPKLLEKITAKTISSMKSAKGIRRIYTSDGDLMSPAGPPTYSKVVEAAWESLEDFLDWTQSPSAQSDKDFLIENGAQLLFFELDEIL